MGAEYIVSSDSVQPKESNLPLGEGTRPNTLNLPREPAALGSLLLTIIDNLPDLILTLLTSAVTDYQGKSLTPVPFSHGKIAWPRSTRTPVATSLAMSTAPSMST